ncbi:MAG: serine--tRNA ligase [Nitriliruptorales bacterium]|nr:serine--tRNA ligase [Nitriliruptorales bacterium]
MHDPRMLLDPATDAVRRLARRGFTLEMPVLEDLLSRRNQAIARIGELRNQAKRVADTVRDTAQAGGDSTALKEQARPLKDEIGSTEEEQQKLSAELHSFLLTIPNLPDDRAPDGDSDEFASEIRRWETPPLFDHPKDHVDIGEGLGIFDLKRATKLSGPRFSILSGPGAALDRAIARFFLDLHTQRHGYTEYAVPSLVTRDTMTGTGQLPKFEEDLFKTSFGSRELFLIPTAEVPLTNLYADEILNTTALPLALTAHTPCFRSEAGSYGRDTRGILRLHEFSKVELVRVCASEDSSQELEVMLGHAEACLRELGLAYRVVALAAGDIGFAARFTYDVEVWLPSQQQYREISSCSDCGTFQARRAKIRARDKDGKKSLVATLNGSGLPIGRTLAAILEQNQQPDGSVVMPEALVPYLGFRVIHPGGETKN